MQDGSPEILVRGGDDTPAGPSHSLVEQALRERDFARLRQLLAELEPPEVAAVIEGLASEDRAVVFRLLRREQAADTFEYLAPDVQQSLIKGLAQEQVATILNDMAPDDRTHLLEELPAAVTVQALALLSAEERAVARRLLGYPEDSIGRLMTPDFISVRGDWTVQQALDHIRLHGRDSETLSLINVVDGSGHLIDDLRVRELLLADPASPIRELIDGHFVALKATDDQETAVRVFQEYDRVAFPVTDSRGVLLGIVTVDDVLDVAEEEATEDIQKIGGSEALESPYMQVAFVTMLQKRAGWLIALFVGQLLTLHAIDFFSEKIAQALVLVLFVPLIISSGGNSGSQAATLVVRAMALGELRPADWWRVLRREILFGLIVGSALAGIGFLRVFAGQRLGEGFGDDWARVALAVGVSLIGVVVWGVLIGSMLPFVMRWCGADPAASSTPVVATIVDVTGLVLYLSVSTALLF